MAASDLESLADDVPTNPADVAALRAAARRAKVTVEDLESLRRQLGGPSPQELRARPVTTGQPFTLDAD